MSNPDEIPAHTDLQARRAAASRYRPPHVHTLLIAEAPPAAPDRYFYFENVTEQDSLFRHVAEGILGHKPLRRQKAEALALLRDLGIYLQDVSEQPITPGTSLAPHVPHLVERVTRLEPDKIILIKVTVYDTAYQPLADAGLPVIPIRMPFPGSRRQAEFRRAFTQALSLAAGGSAD